MSQDPSQILLVLDEQTNELTLQQSENVDPEIIKDIGSLSQLYQEYQQNEQDIQNERQLLQDQIIRIQMQLHELMKVGQNSFDAIELTRQKLEEEKSKEKDIKQFYEQLEDINLQIDKQNQ